MKLVVLFAAGLVYIGSVNGMFDCRHGGNDCQNGATCDEGTGQCVNCPASYEGYDCSVVIADKSHNTCTAQPCRNGGTCHRPSGGSRNCLCTQDYTGNTCRDKRYDLTCSYTGDGAMSITVRPFVNSFTGTVYVYGKKDVSACVFSGTPPTLSGLSHTDTTCGPTTNSGNEKSRIIVIQYENLETIFDEYVTFTCGDEPTVFLDMAPISINNVNISDFMAITTSLAPLDDDIQLNMVASSVDTSGNVDVGAQIMVTVDLSDIGDTKFADIRVESCYAQPTNALSDPDMVYLIQNSCIDSDMEPMIVGDITKDGQAVSFTFIAFKFEDVNTVYFTCVIKPCGDDDDCTAPTCADGSPGYGRKRRDVAGKKARDMNTRKKRQAGSTDKVLQSSFTVNDPYIAAATALHGFKDSKDCYQTWEMTATVVALAVALVIVLLICVVLAVKVITKSKPSSYREDMSVCSSSTHLPSLPTIVPNK